MDSPRDSRVHTPSQRSYADDNQLDEHSVDHNNSNSYMTPKRPTSNRSNSELNTSSNMRAYKKKSRASSRSRSARSQRSNVLQQGEENLEQPEQEFQAEASVDPENQVDQELMDLVDQESNRIKRETLAALNVARAAQKLTPLHLDMVSTLIADDYIEFLKNNPPDTDILQQLAEEYGNLCPFKSLIGTSEFEEAGTLPTDLVEETIDIGRTFLDDLKDREVLMDPEINHIGIGFALTRERILLMTILSRRTLAVTAIKEGVNYEEVKGLEIYGQMLVDTHGLYAVRLQRQETRKEVALVGPENMTFDLKTKKFTVFLPLDEALGDPVKLVEFYIRKKPETIEYGEPRKDKINTNHLELAHKYPCILHPNTKEITEDQEDRLKKEQDEVEKLKNRTIEIAQKEEEAFERKELRRILRKILEAGGEEQADLVYPSTIVQKRRKRWQDAYGPKKRDLSRRGSELPEMKEKIKLNTQSDEVAKSEGRSVSNEGYEKSVKDNNEDDSSSIRSREQHNIDPDYVVMEEGQEDQELEDDPIIKRRVPKFAEREEVEPTGPSENTKIRQELEVAVDEVQDEYERLENRRNFLQSLVLELKEKNNTLFERYGEQLGMTEGRYLNMLTHVHQIRMELKNTQDKYNEMAKELQRRLENKQVSCNDIKNGFKNLMAEVTKNAVHSKTDKPIADKKALEWLEREEEKMRELQALRLENIRLRNQLAKNQQTLKKKEELADGLHLIDYEQLKIENQTLCEKIEERNEELHKLKKNNMQVVQVLTHVKEKLVYVQHSNANLHDSETNLVKEVNSLRLSLSELKKEKKKYMTQNEEMQQQMGIMTNQYLRRDYERLDESLKNDRPKLNYLEAKLQYMSEIMADYAKTTKWKKVVNNGDDIFGSPNKLMNSPNKFMHSPQKSVGSVGSPQKLFSTPQKMKVSQSMVLPSPNKIMNSPQQLSINPQKLFSTPQRY